MQIKIQPTKLQIAIGGFPHVALEGSTLILEIGAISLILAKGSASRSVVVRGSQAVYRSGPIIKTTEPTKLCRNGCIFASKVALAEDKRFLWSLIRSLSVLIYYTY